MKRNIALLLLASASLLCSCGAQEGGSSQSQESSSEPPSSSAEAVDYFAILSEEQGLYSVSFSYQIKSSDGSVTYATGLSSKRLYVGVDEYQAEVKIFHMQGQSTTYVTSLDENASTTSESYSIYYTPTRTYEQQSNGQYSNTEEAHGNETFQPMEIGFDFSQAASYSGQASGFQTVVTPTFENDAKGVAFLGTALGSAEVAAGFTGLSCSVTLDSNHDIVSAAASATKSGLSYTFSWTTSTSNSEITLP